MPSQTLIFTALPNGTVPGDAATLRLSVFVSPRLVTDPAPAPQALSAFPDFMNWPAKHLAWHVTIDGASAGPVKVVSPPARSDLWTKLFGSTTFVQSFDPASLNGNRFHSYPAGYVRDFHLSTYANFASKSPTEFPTYANLIGLPGEPPGALAGLAYNDLLEAEAVRQITALYDRGRFGAIAPAGSPNPMTDLQQAKDFLQPLTVHPAGTTWPIPKTPVPDIDFHRMISMLGEYPLLLRLFGLVVDLEVPRPAGLLPTVQVTATATWTPTLSATSNVVATTGATSGNFLAEPRSSGPEIFSGVLRLSDTAAGGQSAYPLIELELDGSTLKTLNFANGIWRATEQLPSADTPTNYALPALRSAGLAMAHTGQALSFGQTMANTDALNSAVAGSQPVVLSAEDVTRGFRIDVLDSHTNRWHQLCARSAAPTPGGYAIGKSPHVEVVPVPAGDEGWVALSVASGPAGGSSDTYLSETVLRWAGWSLVAPRPGKHLSADPADGLQSDANNPPSGDFPLQVAYRATPGTLPVLRYGRTYRFRARAVDLAGNSVPFAAAPTAFSLGWASPALRYGRLEPITSPPLVPHGPRTPGEHAERIVIRSEFWNTPDSTVAASARHVVPPSTTEEMAEAHGALDGANGVPEKSKYSVIAPLAGKTYATPSVVASLGGKPDPGGFDQPYYPVSELEVPYLPDVFARGAALLGLPGTAVSTPVKVPFHDASTRWPKARSFRLVVKAGSGAPHLPSATNSYALTVRAPKATMQTVRLSCFLAAGDLMSMGLWEWLEELGLATSQIKSVITAGRHYMFTPFRELVIVHAVRQPLTVPRFTKPVISRSIGDTFALLSDTIEVDVKSSVKLDILSSWDEPYDDGKNPVGSVLVHHTSAVGEVPLALREPPPSKVAVSDLRHDFGDTKHRMVFYEAKATTRFLEYFAETKDVTLHGTSPATVNSGGLATGATVVSSTTTPAITYQPTVDYVENDAAGTIARTPSSSIPLASGVATVQVRYVPPPVIRSSLEKVVAPATKKGYRLSTPSSARPVAPDVRYVLPLFSFATSTGSGKVVSRRTGNAVRVYLGRPWWSSGESELLGVVVYPVPAGAAGYPDGLEPYVTRYGRDPLRATNPVKASPALGDFSLATRTGSGLMLAEAAALGPPPPSVDVAGHAVAFDATRGLWYCDIEINTSARNPTGGLGTVGSYWPFVRLALVRYQPYSLSGVETSRVVQADFVQLASDRVATLTFPAPNKVSVTVTGFGYSDGPVVGPSVMDATVEEQRPKVTDPDLVWTEVAGSQTSLGATFVGEGVVSWSGTVTLPVARGSRPLRIRIEEAELYIGPGGSFVPQYAPRVTYIETLQI